MSVYETYETVREPRRNGSRREKRYEYDEPPARYSQVTETRYIPTVVDPPQYRQDLQVRRHDSDLSIEEIPRDPRDFDQRYGPVRSRSVDRDRRRQYDDRDYDRDYDRRVEKREFLDVKDRPDISRRRSLSRNQKIASAVAGAAAVVGAKELYDWKQAKDHPESPRERNLGLNVALGAAGAFAGYEGAQVAKKVKDKRDGKKELKYTREVEYDRNGHVIDYEEQIEEKRPKPSRRKSIVETALGIAGLGGAAKALSGRDKDDDRRDRGRRDSYSDDDRSRRHRSRSRSGDNMAKFQQAAKAALLAGATEAYRVRKEPGGWDGAKGKRILTAAVTAGGVGAAVSKGEDDGKSKRHLMEAVIGGLAGTKAVHGSRKELDVDQDGRSIRDRSRSRARSKSRNGRDKGSSGGALAGLPIAAIGAALLAKKAHSRSRSRSRRRRSDSEDSYRSRGKRSRSKSVTDFARKGIAALGLGGAAAASHRSRSRSRDREVIEKTTIRKERRRRPESRDRGYESSDDEYDRRRSGNRSRGVSRDRDSDHDDRRRDRERGSAGRNRRVAEGKQNASDSDSLGSSSGDEKRIKKIKGRQFLTAGLATVATIHAAHGVYQSYEQRQARRKAVLEGDLSMQEARKMKAKARLQDVASIGIAVLGVKGAVSEWKDMTEKRHEYLKLENEKKERHEKRLERRKSIVSGSSSRSIGGPPNRAVTMGPGVGHAHDESDDDRDLRYSNSSRPNYQRHTSFPNRSEPDLPRYYDEEDKPYYYPPPPAPGSGYHGAPYGQQPASKLPPPPMGYDYDSRR